MSLPELADDGTTVEYAISGVILLNCTKLGTSYKTFLQRSGNYPQSKFFP